MIQSALLFSRYWFFSSSFSSSDLWSLFLVAGKVYNYGCNLTPSLWAWGLSPKSNGFGNLGEQMTGGNITGCINGVGSHCSTVERLYAWEKKLYQEVKVPDLLSFPYFFFLRISLS